MKERRAAGHLLLPCGGGGSGGGGLSRGERRGERQRLRGQRLGGGKADAGALVDWRGRCLGSLRGLNDRPWGGAGAATLHGAS